MSNVTAAQKILQKTPKNTKKKKNVNSQKKKKYCCIYYFIYILNNAIRALEFRVGNCGG